MSSLDVKKFDMTAISTSGESGNDRQDCRKFDIQTPPIIGSNTEASVVDDINGINEKLAVPPTLSLGGNSSGESTELKQFYHEIINEIDLFQSKIDSLKDLRHMYEENDLVFAIHERLCTWIDLKKEMYAHKVKDPSPGIVLYVKYIIESLVENQLTEKEIKSYVVDACKDSFIKSTNRGTIAGLNLEVTTVCGALAALGILQQDLGTFSIFNERLELSKFRCVNSNISNEETKSTRLEIDEFISKELEFIPDGVGKVMLQSISDRWNHAIPSYIEYSRKALLRQMHRDAAKAAAAEEAERALALILTNETINAENDSSGGKVYSDNADLASTGENASTAALRVDVHDTSLPLNDAQVRIDNNEMVIESSYVMDPDTGTVDDSRIMVSVDANDSTDANTSYMSLDAPNSRKRASNQRSWMLDEKFISGGLLASGRILSKWSNLAYEEQKFLEIEESLLRRLAAQCGIPLLKSAYRVGTSYLSNSYVYDDSNDLPVAETNQDVTSSKPLLEQVELTGNMLVDRLYKTKHKSKKPKMSHSGCHSVSYGYYNSNNIPSYLADLNSINFTRNPAGNLIGCELRDDYAILKSNMFLDPPLYAPYPYTINKTQLVQATIIMPDLLIKTSEIPWEMMAEEFVPLTADDSVDDVRVTHNGLTSAQSSPRASSSDLRRNSSGAFSDKSPRSSQEIKDKKRPSFNGENQQLSRTSSAVNMDKLEVLAPLFHEIVPVTSSAFVITSDGESDEEITKDLSDSAVAAKHEEKLKYMKHRWELLQSLKRGNSHSMTHVYPAVISGNNSSKKKKSKSTYYSKKKLIGVECSISTERGVAANGSIDSVNDVAKLFESGNDSSHDVVPMSE